MVERNATQVKEDIFRLLEISYPNMRQKLLRTTFDKHFAAEDCLYVSEDERVVSTLQIHTACIRFLRHCLEVSIFDQIATHPDYRRRHKMSELMEAAMDEAGHNQLFTFIYAMNPRLFERYGFRVIHTSKRYLLASSELARVSFHQVDTRGDAAMMLRLYRRFIRHFDGCFIRDEAFYERLLAQRENGERVCFYYGKNQELQGYCVYLLEHQEARVFEIVYLDSRGLKQMLAYIARSVTNIQLVVSQAEKLEKIFPFVIPRRETFLMARLNHPSLFNKLYNTSVRNSVEAFALLKKPMWNHSR